MVKLSRSRKGVRKNKSSSSRKSRKSMVGGKFTEVEGDYSRKKFGVNLYNLTYKVVEGKNVYTLDFTKSQTEDGSIASRGVRAFSSVDKYTSVLKEALKCQDPNHNAVIAGIVYALFDGGKTNVTTRKIKITQDSNNSTVELLSANDEIILSGNVISTKSMTEMFNSLGDEVNPINT